MKKSLLALAALTAFAGVASAQSSVTLSGSVDAGLKRQFKATTGTNNAADWNIGGSQSAYNSFTMSGIEDLGNGARAIFALNHRFSLNNGADNGYSNGGGTGTANNKTTSEPFWRNAYVGLGGGFGEVRVGRFLMPLQDMNGGFDAFNTGTVGTVHTGGINATIRPSNIISYRSPSLGGVSVQLSGATSDGQVSNEIGSGSGVQKYFTPDALLGNRAAGGFVRYAAGPVNLGLAYDKNPGKVKTIGLYGSYDFGVLKLLTQFEKGDNYTSLTSLRTTPDENVKAFSLGLTAPLGPVVLRTGFLRIKGTPINGAAAPAKAQNATKFGFGGDYNLSKRTNLYTTVGKWSGDRVVPLTGATANNTANQKVQFDLGITHRF